MRDEEFISWGGPEKTLNERWNTDDRPGHWYGASTEFAKNTLGEGSGRSCLVIGSPLFEAHSLRALGWDVTYLDVRKPQNLRCKFIQCDAMNITLPDASFDAVSSSCVLTHVGTGRYGDGSDMAHGDEKMLAHVARVLKPDGIAVLTFGACVARQRMVRLGSWHRIYTLAECRRMLKEAGFNSCEWKVWSFVGKRWLDEGEQMTQDIHSPDYISFKAWKVNKCGS